MTPEEVTKILLDAWSKREPHVHGLALLVGVDATGAQHYRVDLLTTITFLADQWHVPLPESRELKTVTRYRVTGIKFRQHPKPNEAVEEPYVEEVAGEENAILRVKRLSEVGMDFKYEAFEAMQIIRYAKRYRIAKHLYFETEKEEQHIVDLIEKGSAILPDAARAHRDYELQPNDEAHNAVDNDEIPQAVTEWKLLFKRDA